MNDLYLNQNQFSDTINIYNLTFKPLTKFPNKDELMDILLKNKFKGKYFPFPIFFGLTKNKYLEIKEKKKLNLFYKKKLIMKIKISTFFYLDKKSLVKFYLVKIT